MPVNSIFKEAFEPGVSLSSKEKVVHCLAASKSTLGDELISVPFCETELDCTSSSKVFREMDLLSSFTSSLYLLIFQARVEGGAHWHEAFLTNSIMTVPLYLKVSKFGSNIKS